MRRRHLVLFLRGLRWQRRRPADDPLLDVAQRELLPELTEAIVRCHHRVYAENEN